jgi:hypothetical protein
MNTYTSASYRIAGRNSGSSSRGAEEQPEIPEQEVPEAAEEVGEDLPECPDHRPSSFERGKPRSIISLLLYKACYYIYVIYLMH